MSSTFLGNEKEETKPFLDKADMYRLGGQPGELLFFVANPRKLYYDSKSGFFY